MASFLYRLGQFAYRRKVTVISVWMIALLGLGTAALQLHEPMTSAFSLPGTESQLALDQLEARMGTTLGSNASARVVFVAAKGKTVTSAASMQAIEKAVAELRHLPHVASVADPVKARAIAPNGSVAYASVTYGVAATDITAAEREQLFSAGRSATSAGLRVEFAGDASAEPVQPGGGKEGLGLAVAAVVLIMTFGSLLAAGLPLLTAIIGVGSGALTILIATRFTDLGATTLTLALMLGLAVGIDYALFILSRFRHELLSGRQGEEAAGRALGTAGSAVVFAGATVAIALVALSVVRIPFLTAMGIAAAGTVVLAVLVALTLLPAMLGVFGVRVLGKRGLAARDAEADTEASFGERWARGVIRHRIPVTITAVALLGALAVPALDLQLGMPSDGTASPTTTQRRAFDAMAAGFGPGINGPLIITADLADTNVPARAVNTLRDDLAAVPGVAFATRATLNQAGDFAVLTVIPTTGPLDPATQDLVRTIRSDSAAWHAQTNATAYVTGSTAIDIDTAERLKSALLPYLLVVVGLAFLLLMLVFRSILIPIKAAVGFLLSILATLGAVVAVFQWGWLQQLFGLDTTSPVLSFLPILVVGVLFGLAMDYEVFLVSRIREEHVHGASATDAIVHGFGHGARVITAAGLIMVSVFTGFILSDEAVVKSMGFALATGVILDAFVVRLTLVPAVMALLGDKAWWIPQSLERRLPNIDVEGARLDEPTRASRGSEEDARSFSIG